MKCWHCNTELTWGGDHDLEDNEDYTMVTNLSCQSCDAYVEVYLPKGKEFFKKLMDDSHASIN